MSFRMLQTRRAAAHLAALLFCLIISAPAFALDVPALKGRVNDYANLLPPERARALEERLEQFENETGHQIAVLTVPALDGEDIEGFGIRVAESWKIGKKGADNGAILIIARQDRKLRIEVGYGLEGVLPDAVANRIIQEVIVPRFKAGDFPGGVEAGIAAMINVAKGEPLPAAQRKKAAGSGFPVALILPLFLLGFFLLSALGGRSRQGIWSTRGRRGYYGPGGFFGGGFGGGGGGGGFSGGGGGFGGGGASGSW